MIKIYVVGAYRDKRGANFVRNNIRAAELAGQELALLSDKICPIVPHLLWGLWDGLKAEDYFLECGRAVLGMCNAILVLPSYKNSEGSKREIELARKSGKHIFYYPQDMPKITEYVNKVEWSVVNEQKGNSQEKTESK